MLSIHGTGSHYVGPTDHQPQKVLKILELMHKKAQHNHFNVIHLMEHLVSCDRITFCDCITFKLQTTRRCVYENPH